MYDDASSRPAVAAIMKRCGFAVAVLRGPVSELVAQTRALSPELVVFDLGSGGSRGLRVVRDLHVAAPGCIVVLMAPFEGLREPALAAGAYELTGKDDLRDLERCLRRLTAELDAKGSADRGVQPHFFADPRSQRESEQETLVVVGQVAPMAASQTAGNGEPESGTTFAVQADETVEDLPDRFRGNAWSVVGDEDT